MVLSVFRVLVFFSLFFMGRFAACAASNEQFQNLLNSDPSRVSAAQCKGAPQFQYVFVPGIFNELMPYYFADQIKWLAHCGVAKKDIHVAKTSSTLTLFAAAQTLESQFQRLLSKEPNKRLVIMGHSKGAPEALAAILQSSREVQEHVASIVLVQGSFAGTPIADLALGHHSRFHSHSDPLVERAARKLAKILNWAIRFYGPDILSGVFYIKPTEALKFWSPFLKAHSDSNILLENKILVLQTHKKKSRLNALILLSGEYLSRITLEESDGIIPFSSQMPPIENLKSAILSLDHLDTVLPRIFSFSSPQIRYHLMASIVGATR